MIRCLLMIICWVLTGCAVTPTSIVPHQTTARPETVVPPPVSKNGAIFQTASFRPLFEDYRARAVGDVLTVVIREKVSADKKNTASDNKTGKIDAHLDKMLGLKIAGMEAAEETKIQSDGKAAGSASYNFSGSIAVTVIEVLPNGNLLVSGEKQIGMDKGTEFIRLSGVVAPITIEIGNTIPSTKLADARVEYRTNAQVDPAELLKSLNRIFSTVLLL